MISWGDIGGKRKPSRFTPVSPTCRPGRVHKAKLAAVRLMLQCCTYVLVYHVGNLNFATPI
jgi:hypothetical protein